MLFHRDLRAEELEHVVKHSPLPRHRLRGIVGLFPVEIQLRHPGQRLVGEVGSFNFSLSSRFLLFQEAQLEKQSLGRIRGLGGFLVLLALGVVPNEPNVLRFGVPAQPAWEFGSFLVLHVIYFLQISESVKRALIRHMPLPQTLDQLKACGMYTGVSGSSGVCANQNVASLMLPASVLEGIKNRKSLKNIWLPPRDSNPDMLIQSQLSCR
jgi:hypothetical protein